MKLDQLAIYVHNKEQAEEAAATFGLKLADFDTRDTVVGAVRIPEKAGCGITFPDHTAFASADLMFNYSLGIELEFLTYTDGRHWHETGEDFLRGLPFTSHVGFHMSPGEEIPESNSNCPVVQEMTTISHTNQYLIDQKRYYRYLIVDTRDLIGFYSKYIWRIEHEADK